MIPIICVCDQQPTRPTSGGALTIYVWIHTPDGARLDTSTNLQGTLIRHIKAIRRWCPRRSVFQSVLFLIRLPWITPDVDIPPEHLRPYFGWTND